LIHFGYLQEHNTHHFLKLSPTVTIGLWSAGKINQANAIGYVFAQCLGAIAAALLIKNCIPSEILSSINMGTPGLGSGITERIQRIAVGL
jgi:glycerol uptake facilitator-like aquaporin